MFRSLRVRNFRRFASANLVSNTGTWMQRIGQDWLVLQLSDDNGVALGLITALQFGPSLLLSMYGGVLADRYDKRRMLLVTQSLMGLLALALGILVATDVVALWHVFLLAFGLGAVAAIDAPVRQAFVSEMVGPGLLANAVSLNSTIFNGARLRGPGRRRAAHRRVRGQHRAGVLRERGELRVHHRGAGGTAHRRAAAEPSGGAGGRSAAGGAGLHVGAPGPDAGDGAGLRRRHLRRSTTRSRSR